MEWISIKDRLPKEKEDVLLFSRHIAHEEIKTGHLYDIDDLDWVDDHIHPVLGVTHWMPLPEPPNLELMQQQAVENFLSSLDMHMPMVDHFENAARDSEIYHWDSKTVISIFMGIEDAYRGKNK